MTHPLIDLELIISQDQSTSTNAPDSKSLTIQYNQFQAYLKTLRRNAVSEQRSNVQPVEHLQKLVA